MLDFSLYLRFGKHLDYWIYIVFIMLPMDTLVSENNSHIIEYLLAVIKKLGIIKLIHFIRTLPVLFFIHYVTGKILQDRKCFYSFTDKLRQLFSNKTLHLSKALIKCCVP